MDQQENDALFHALADATRRDIVRRSFLAEHSISSLARLYPMSFAAVQKHVAVLERAQMVTKEQRGREQIVHSNVETLHRAVGLLEQLEEEWRGRIDRISRILEEEKESKGGTP